MSLFSPRKEPLLPQQEREHAAQKRAKDLEKAREDYPWTVGVPTLPGVPLLDGLPKAEKPGLDWLLKVAEPGLAILRNQLAVKRARATTPDDAAMGAAEAHIRLLEDHLAAKVALGGLVGADPAEALGEALHAAVGDLGIPFGEGTQPSHASQLAVGGEKAIGIGDYRDLFQTIPPPSIAWNFENNVAFAELRLSGPNAAMIQGIDSLPPNFALTPEDYARVVPGDRLDSALAEGRLFLLDYRPLAAIETGTGEGGATKYLWAPLALFGRRPGSGSLLPVAIQTGQDPAKDPLVLVSEDPNDVAWALARAIVQVADGNYHELIAHLAGTHLVIEAFAVATHRQLAEIHPIALLLLPHVKGTLSINASAAGSLISTGGPIDQIFAGQIASTQQAAVTARLGFDFTGRMLPHDLEARKVGPDRLPQYAYRDDALLVWAAIEAWVANYVALYYPDEATFAADTEIAAWSADLLENGKLAGFGGVASRESLVETLTMVIFTGSAQHAAVNFPQRTVMTFAPGVSGAGWAPGPEVPPLNRAHWLAMYPPLDLAQKQLNTLQLLGGVYYNLLGEYETGGVLSRAWFEDPAIVADDGPLARFRARLAEIETVITTRNRQRDTPYPYLLPSLIPASINI